MPASRIFPWLERHSGRVLAAVLGLTVLMLPAMILLAPDTEASTDPRGEVFDTRELLDAQLVSPVLETFWIAEARNGDMLTQEPLLELYQNSQALRDDPEVGPLLVEFDSAAFQERYAGIYTIADGVDRWLREDGLADGLAGATDNDVKRAAAALLTDGAPTAALGESFAVSTTVERRDVDGEEIDYWVVPAFGLRVFADNEALGGGSFSINFGGDEVTLAKEQFNRDVREVLRGEATAFQVWGAGIDVNLSSEDEGATAAPFIAMSIVAVLVVAGIILRSYWAVALIGGALALLIVWLRALSNLVGLDSSLLVSFIVPIAMVSFGVDFAFHAIGRYRETLAAGIAEHRGAFTGGLAAVSGALLLALASDALAFLANVIAGIPAIIQFGIAAAIALCAAYLLLGLVVPLALMRIEERLRPQQPETRRQALGQWAAMGGAALGAGATVLVLIVLPAAGAGLLATYLVIALGIPLWRASAREGAAGDHPTHGASFAWMGSIVVTIASARYAVLPVALAVSLGAALLARDVEVKFDARDFFSSGSDFVVGLDKLDEHISSGEEASIYIEGALDHPEALAAIADFVEELDTSETGRIGRYADGALQADPGALLIVQSALASAEALETIEASTGVSLTDADGDLVADSPEANRAIYTYAGEHGIPGNGGMVLSANAVPSRIAFSSDGEPWATRIDLGLIGTREQANVRAARDELEPMMGRLETRLAAVDGDAYVSLTGSPIERDAGLQATVRALVLSLPIAVALCFVVAAVFMRSLRHAAVTIVPILCVVAWLYGFMAVFGFPLNLATATIGAISVGVGIDYAVHFSMRFRDELERMGRRHEALHIAGAGTGAALFASAASSAVGFTIMAFAPMPLFATYGLLTAVMIVSSAAASLLILPSLLMLVSRDRVGADARTASAPGA